MKNENKKIYKNFPTACTIRIKFVPTYMTVYIYKILYSWYTKIGPLFLRCVVKRAQFIRNKIKYNPTHLTCNQCVVSPACS